MRLLTVESVIDQLGITPTSKTYGVIRAAVIMATQHLESYLQTQFEHDGAVVDTFYLDPSDLSRQKTVQRLLLSRAFVSTPVTVTAGSSVTSLSEVSLDNATVDNARGLLVFMDGPRQGFLRVSYAAGFTTVVDPSPDNIYGDLIPANPADVPASLLSAAMMLSMVYYKMKDECPDGNANCLYKGFCKAQLLLEPFDRRRPSAYISL